MSTKLQSNLLTNCTERVVRCLPVDQVILEFLKGRQINGFDKLAITKAENYNNGISVSQKQRNKREDGISLQKNKERRKLTNGLVLFIYQHSFSSK